MSETWSKHFLLVNVCVCVFVQMRWRIYIFEMPNSLCHITNTIRISTSSVYFFFISVIFFGLFLVTHVCIEPLFVVGDNFVLRHQIYVFSVICFRVSHIFFVGLFRGWQSVWKLIEFGVNSSWHFYSSSFSPRACVCVCVIFLIASAFFPSVWCWDYISLNSLTYILCTAKWKLDMIIYSWTNNNFVFAMFTKVHPMLRVCVMGAHVQCKHYFHQMKNELCVLFRSPVFCRRHSAIGCPYVYRICPTFFCTHVLQQLWTSLTLLFRYEIYHVVVCVCVCGVSFSLFLFLIKSYSCYTFFFPCDSSWTSLGCWPCYQHLTSRKTLCLWFGFHFRSKWKCENEGQHVFKNWSKEVKLSMLTCI